MPDTRHDRDSLRALLTSPYSYREEERLEALKKPRPQRWFAYTMWLVDAMPPASGTALLMLSILAVLLFLCVLVVGTMLLIDHGGVWLFTLVAGAALGYIGRAILRDAVETEMAYRQSIREKQEKLHREEKEAR